MKIPRLLYVLPQWSQLKGRSPGILSHQKNNLADAQNSKCQSYMTCMAPNVHNKVASASETLSTMITLMAFHVVRSLLMLWIRAAPFKFFTTNSAFVGLLHSMRSTQMSHFFRWFDCFIALFALEQLVPLMFNSIKMLKCSWDIAWTSLKTLKLGRQ